MDWGGVVLTFVTLTIAVSWTMIMMMILMIFGKCWFYQRFPISS